MSNTKRIELYYYDSCPFCARVLNIIKKNNLKVLLKNIQTESSNLERLVKDTGRRTVPCLFINDQPMFESNDIINWLENNLINKE